MQYPVDPDFPRSDEDRELIAPLASLPVRPVFIMGLHRSGTTFLYDSVARAFPLSQLSLYRLFYYRRLLCNARDGQADVDQRKLDACFAALGIRDRKIDSVPVAADEVEEYGFLLRRLGGSFKLSEDTAPLFEEMCRKLLALEPDSEAVLLKNPWDTANARWIAGRYEQARFIYISREPIAVLNSMLNAFLAYLDGPQHYLEMLLDTGNGRKGYRKGYLIWLLMRGLRAVLGERAIALLARPMLARHVAREVVSYRQQLAAMPGNQAVEVDYAQLVQNPGETMTALAEFLDLPLRNVDELGLRAAKPRHSVHPILKAYEASLNRQVDKAMRAAKPA